MKHDLERLIANVFEQIKVVRPDAINFTVHSDGSCELESSCEVEGIHSTTEGFDSVSDMSSITHMVPETVLISRRGDKIWGVLEENVGMNSVNVINRTERNSSTYNCDCTIEIRAEDEYYDGTGMSVVPPNMVGIWRSDGHIADHGYTPEFKNFTSLYLTRKVLRLIEEQV